MSSVPLPTCSLAAEASSLESITQTSDTLESHGMIGCPPIGISDRIRSLRVGTPSTHESASGPSTNVQENVAPYLYYQIFSFDGAIESKCAFREDDPYTGRVVASRITPRTAELIKQFLCKQEGIPDVESTDLFATVIDERKPEDEEPPQIHARDGQGWSADDPMAIIVKSASHTPPTTCQSHMVSFDPSKFSSTSIQLKCHAEAVWSIAISSDGALLVSGSVSGEMLVWDIESREVVIGPILTSSVYSVAFSPDGRQIVSAHLSFPFISRWDAQTGVSLGPLQGQLSSVHSVSFSPNGRWIASASDDNYIRVYDVQNEGALIHTIEAHTRWVRVVAFSADGSRLASGSDDCTVRVWDPETGICLTRPFEGHNLHVNSVAFSPDGKWLASGSSDGDVRIWELETSLGDSSSTGPTTRCWARHAASVVSVVFSPDGRYVLSGSMDRTVRIWDFKMGQTVTMLRPFGWIYSLVVSPKGDTILAGTYNGTIEMWRKAESIQKGGPLHV